jgi:preprotein translocase subunit SecB
MLNALQVERHYFVETRLAAEIGLSEAELKKRNVTCRPNLAWSHKTGDTTFWIAKLKLELLHADDGTKSLYTGVLENAGEFRLHSDVPEKERQKYVAMNVGAILYGAMREWVATMTARSLHGLVELPTIDARCFIPKETGATNAPNQIEEKK